MLYMSVSNKPLIHFPGPDEMKCFLSFREQGMQKVIGDFILFYLFILFPYIPFRYIPWKWKTSHSIYIIRQLAPGITSIAKVENYLSTTVITFLS